MFTGMQEAMLESPVLGEIAPGIVFQQPAIMSELSYLPDGKGFASSVVIHTHFSDLVSETRFPCW